MTAAAKEAAHAPRCAKVDGERDTTGYTSERCTCGLDNPEEAVPAGMLPEPLWARSDEWYTLCERAPHATSINISGELAQAIVDTVCTQSADQLQDGLALKLDTDTQVFFYEQDFYVLSNFSAFTLLWKGRRFDTSEAAYHWEKFPDAPEVQSMIRLAPSAHEAFKIAERHRSARRPDWDSIKVSVMREILWAKADQHEYVRRKLLATGSRELVENSWRDDYWGWGLNRDGRNMLGTLWMEIRAAINAASPHVQRQERECPYRMRCECVGRCKHGFSGSGAERDVPGSTDGR